MLIKLFTIVSFIYLFQVVTMYTNSGASGAKHQWVQSISSVGAPSYINIRVYRAFSGSMMTSLSCRSLGSSSFLRVPRTNFLLSLVSYAIQPFKHISPDAQPYSFVALPSSVMEILSVLQFRVAEVLECVKSLENLVKGKSMASIIEVHSGPDDSEGESGDEEE